MIEHPEVKLIRIWEVTVGPKPTAKYIYIQPEWFIEKKPRSNKYWFNQNDSRNFLESGGTQLDWLVLQKNSQTNWAQNQGGQQTKLLSVEKDGCELVNWLRRGANVLIYHMAT